jgi:hypothetical protein
MSDSKIRKASGVRGKEMSPDALTLSRLTVLPSRLAALGSPNAFPLDTGRTWR